MINSINKKWRNLINLEVILITLDFELYYLLTRLYTKLCYIVLISRVTKVIYFIYIKCQLCTLILNKVGLSAKESELISLAFAELKC